MIGILLINLGTPDAPTAKAVRRYLREFLTDPRVIDIPALPRSLLVHLVIAPFRSPRSAKQYRKIWTDSGSPLLVHSAELARQVSERLSSRYVVELGMRYGQPSIAAAMEALIRRGAKTIRVLPLYPQYSASATGSAAAEVFRVARELWDPPPVHILQPFYNHLGFVNSYAEVARPILAKNQFDFVLFSFHGLPERQIRKSDRSGKHCLVTADCCEQTTAANEFCYRHQCLITASAIAKALAIREDGYTVCFQSRLGRTPWIRPYTDQVLTRLPAQGIRRVAVFCPSFVSDCLETLEEIAIRGRESFLQAGGEQLQLIPCPNAHPSWVETVCEMVR
jgi:ferrochelatase